MITEREKKNATQKLQLRIRVTSQCRYNAAKRLQQIGKYNFFTTTVLSLGLIFIPLMQGAGIYFYLSEKVLSSVQVFLAVTVLVYSVIIATAKYELRSNLLTRCGDKLKELNRKVEAACIEAKENDMQLDNEHLKKFNRLYTDIVAECENHEDEDYKRTVLEMKNDYPYLKKRQRFYNYATIVLGLFVNFLIPTLFIIIEFLIILDMLGITIIFKFLQATK